MKFTNAAFFATVLAVASASPAPAVTSTAMTPTESCINACPSNAQWSSCAAKCENVPAPNSSEVEADRRCVAKCPQGNGSPEETQQYYQCMNECAKAHYFTGGLQTPVPVTDASSAVATTETSSPSLVQSTTKKSGSGETTTTKKSSSGPTTKSSSHSTMPAPHGMGGNSTSKPSGKPSSTNSGSGASNTQVGSTVAAVAGFLLWIFAL